MTHFRNDAVNFDDVAETYEAQLQRGLALSGESQAYFAQRRIKWLRRGLGGAKVGRALDYGCGTGVSCPLLRDIVGAQHVLGIDESAEAIAVAGRDRNRNITFGTLNEFRPAGDMDLVYCNGVFHHIKPPSRPAVVRSIYDSLKPGGLFSLWENNPWNPGTRFVMSRIPFDRDAITLSSIESRRMLANNGFEVLRTSFLFIFPKFLAALRAVEPAVASLPFGAQYQVLARKAA